MFPCCKQLLVLLISGFYFADVSKFTRTACEDTVEQGHSRIRLRSGPDQSLRLTAGFFLEFGLGAVGLI